MPVVAVIGAQWGDEGKGKVVDLLSAKAQVVTRSQGGANAGHTILKNGQKVVFHLLPSGILTPACLCLVGPGVVLDPEILSQELDSLTKLQVNPQGRLVLDQRTHLVLPTHKLLDAAHEEARGKDIIGTTSRGIGPTYSDKATRRGVRIGDLLDNGRRRQLCSDLFDYHASLLEKLYNKPVPDKAAFLETCEQWADLLAPFAGNAIEKLHEAVEQDKTVLLEGAQGTLLDLDLGTYPYVTSSHPTVAGSVMGIGLPPSKVNFVLGVIKAYTTRVGGGPFPSEMDEGTAEYVRQRGAEFGSTTGRPRRIGWLDLAAAKYVARLNGIDGWAVTKLDVLDGLEPLRMGIGYQIRGNVITALPATRREWDEVEPVYANLKNWQDCSSKRKVADLPAATMDYLETIEKFTGVPVHLVSLGADADATIMTRGEIL